jgi:hypothetical protein
MSGPLLYSTNTFLKFVILQRFRKDIHWVWCSEIFDSKKLDSYSDRALIAPSSNPADIYRELQRDVAGKDSHSAKITAQKASLQASFLVWALAVACSWCRLIKGQDSALSTSFPTFGGRNSRCWSSKYAQNAERRSLERGATCIVICYSCTCAPQKMLDKSWHASFSCGRLLDAVFVMQSTKDRLHFDSMVCRKAMPL